MACEPEAQAVATQPIAEQAQQAGKDGKKIGELIHAARVASVDASLASAAQGKRNQPTGGGLPAC